MDEQQWYVDQSGSAPVPFENIEKLTPFGGAEIAEMTAAWDTFTPGASDDMFNVQGLASCPMSDQCNQNSNKMKGGSMLHHAKGIKFPSLTTVATRKAEAAAQAEKAAKEKEAAEALAAQKAEEAAAA